MLGLHLLRLISIRQPASPLLSCLLLDSQNHAILTIPYSSVLSSNHMAFNIKCMTTTLHFTPAIFPASLLHMSDCWGGLSPPRASVLPEPHSLSFHPNYPLLVAGISVNKPPLCPVKQTSILASSSALHSSNLPP